MSVKGSRIKYLDAVSIAMSITETLKRENLVQKAFIGGSLIRQAEIVADIDIGIIPTGVYKDGHTWWAETIKEIFSILHMNEDLPKGFKQVCGKEILRLSHFGIQVDIWAAEKRYWGPMCMFIAGNAKLNAIQRIKAKKQDIRLSNKGLFTLDGEDFGEFSSEEKVYDFLGWKWVDYADRNI